MNVLEYKNELEKCLNSISQQSIDENVEILKNAWLNDKQIFVCGNGGSASTASHVGCDLNKGATVEGVRPLRVMGLADNVAHFTALGNDVSFEEIFVGQLRNHFREGDVLIGISASGNSPNCVKAFQYAKEKAGTTIGWLGFSGGKMKELSDSSIVLDSHEYGPVEDGHLIINHMITLAMRDFLNTQKA